MKRGINSLVWNEKMKANMLFSQYCSFGEHPSALLPTGRLTPKPWVTVVGHWRSFTSLHFILGVFLAPISAVTVGSSIHLPAFAADTPNQLKCFAAGDPPVKLVVCCWFDERFSSVVTIYTGMVNFLLLVGHNNFEVGLMFVLLTFVHAILKLCRSSLEDQTKRMYQDFYCYHVLWLAL